MASATSRIEKNAAHYRETAEQISLWLERFRDEARQPEHLQHTLGWAEELAAQGLHQDAAYAIQKAYHESRNPLVERTQNPEPLVAISPFDETYIRVMTAGRYFEDDRAVPFTPIGYNHNPDWQKLMDANPLVPRQGNFEAPAYDPSVTDDWFQHLADHGVNLIRLMVETPQNGNLEDPVGTIQPEHVRWLDNVVLAARRSSIRLMVTPYDTFWMNLKWDKTTYSQVIESKIDWYLQPHLREAQKCRMRFLIDRYGNLGTVFAWELMNEADIWWGASPAQLQAWADEIIAYVRAYEFAKWGRNHLVTISTAEAMPKHELAEFAYRRPDLDFATTHLYIGKSKAPKNADCVIPTTVEGVRHALDQIQDNRPFVDGENGPIDKWIKDETLDDEVHHNQCWAHLCSGGAGSSLRWPYRTPHHLTPGMLTALKHMRTFCDAVDWRKLTGPIRPIHLLLPTGVYGTAFATDEAALIFAAGKDAAEIPVPEGHVRAFDTKEGVWIDPCTSGPSPRSVVFFIQRKDDG